MHFKCSLFLTTKHNFAQYFSEIFSIFLKVSSMSPIIEIKISNLSDRIRAILRIFHFLTQMTHNIEHFHFLDLYVCSFLGEHKHETKVNTKHFSHSSMTCAWVFFPSCNHSIMLIGPICVMGCGSSGSHGSRPNRVPTTRDQRRPVQPLFCQMSIWTTDH